MSIFKKRKTLKKMKNYLAEWDTEQYRFVLIYTDGRLCPTNNNDHDSIRFCKDEFKWLINYIESNF